MNAILADRTCRAHLIRVALSIVAVLTAGLLGRSLYRTAIGDAQDALAGQTTVTATAAASALTSALHSDLQLVAAMAGEGGIDALVQQSASQPTINAVESANFSIQHANPQILGLYFYNHDGAFVMSQVVNPAHQPPHHLSVVCDATSTYCIGSNPPTRGFLASAALQVGLAHAPLLDDLPTQSLAFDRSAGPFGYLFILQPIPAPSGGASLGTLVAQIDAATLFAPYVEAANSNILILDGNVVIDRTMRQYHDRGLLPVTRIDPTLSSAITNGLVQVPVGVTMPDTHASMTVHGAKVVASSIPVHDSTFHIISFAPAPATPSGVGLLVGAAFVVSVLAAGVGGLSVFLRHRQHMQQLTYRATRASAGAHSGGDANAARSRADEIVGARAYGGVPLPPPNHTDHRQAARYPLDYPLRLRLGADLFIGRANNVSPGGIGLWCVQQRTTVPNLEGALTSHERGALELLHGDLRFVARVRIAHVKSSNDGIHVGLAIADSGEAERLIDWLEACNMGTSHSGSDTPEPPPSMREQSRLL
jgi:hypothetical protein